MNSTFVSMQNSQITSWNIIYNCYSLYDMVQFVLKTVESTCGRVLLR